MNQYKPNGREWVTVLESDNLDLVKPGTTIELSDYGFVKYGNVEKVRAVIGGESVDLQVGPYLPRPGECVRVTEVDKDDPTPSHQVGQAVTVHTATKGSRWPNYIVLTEPSTPKSRATWCRVQPIDKEKKMDTKLSREQLVRGQHYLGHLHGAPPESLAAFQFAGLAADMSGFVKDEAGVLYDIDTVRQIPVLPVGTKIKISGEYYEACKPTRLDDQGKLWSDWRHVDANVAQKDTFLCASGIQNWYEVLAALNSLSAQPKSPPPRPYKTQDRLIADEFYVGIRISTGNLEPFQYRHDKDCSGLDTPNRGRFMGPAYYGSGGNYYQLGSAALLPRTLPVNTRIRTRSGDGYVVLEELVFDPERMGYRGKVLADEGHSLMHIEAILISNWPYLLPKAGQAQPLSDPARKDQTNPHWRAGLDQNLVGQCDTIPCTCCGSPMVPRSDGSTLCSPLCLEVGTVGKAYKQALVAEGVRTLARETAIRAGRVVYERQQNREQAASFADWHDRQAGVALGLIKRDGSQLAPVKEPEPEPHPWDSADAPYELYVS